MKNIKKYFQYAALTLMTMMTFAVAPPIATTANAACQQRVLFTFPAWYKGVTDGNCNIKIDQLNDFWVIVMNFIEMLLQVVAYVSVGFIVWGGFKYIKSEGEPAKITEAKSAILNAVIGLVIALMSVAIVEYVQGLII
ncbi:MAG: hypothetical protein ABIR46_02970 [Candidatus Saccharimonadales bacterium]